MIRQLPDWTRALILVAAVVALAGCGMLFGDDPELPDGDEAVETYESLDVYNASFVIESTDENGTDRWEGEYTMRPGSGEFYQMGENADGERIKYIYDGSVEWTYDVDNETVNRVETDGYQILSEQIRQVVNSANAGESDDSGPVIPVGPLLPVADQSSEEVATIGPKEATYDGTETVAGRETHVVTFTAAEQDTQFEQQLYLDTEWYVVMKVATEAESDDEITETTFKYTDIEFEPDLPADRFEFDPPPEATVEAPPIEVVRYNQLEELRKGASIEIPEGELPPEYEFFQARHAVGAPAEFAYDATSKNEVIEEVILQYASDTSVLAIGKANATFEQPTDAESVTIADQTGTYRLLDGQGVVEWECDGNRYSVAGELTRSELISVAESVDC